MKLYHASNIWKNKFVWANTKKGARRKLNEVLLDEHIKTGISIDYDAWDVALIRDTDNKIVKKKKEKKC